MIGKKNIVFGLIFFIFTASLGYLMFKNINSEVAAADQERKTAIGNLKQYKNDNYEKDLEKMPADAIAKAVADGAIALNNLTITRQERVNDIKSGPHAHGNLESMLNILVGILLCFLGVSRLFKQIISWSFILGTILHSGVLFLITLFAHVFNATDSVVFGWLLTILQTGAGPMLLLLGLLLTAIAALIGFRGEVVHDD